MATAEAVLYGDSDVKPDPVVVCGDGEVGAETAEFIAQTSQDVAILEEMVVLDTKCQFLERMEKKHVKILTDARVTSFGEGQVFYQKLLRQTVKSLCNRQRPESGRRHGSDKRGIRNRFENLISILQKTCSQTKCLAVRFFGILAF